MPIIVPTSSGSLKKQRLVDEISGPTGPQGPVGAEGTPGATGPRGNTGIQGNPGATGPVGVTGLQGSTGIQGAQGSQGETGIRGITGLQGIQGSQGDTGIQGKTGIGGLQGETGIQGKTGLGGAQGQTGPIGATGQQGIQGVQGSTGATGVQGLTGSQGIQGAQGNTGIQGIQGSQGNTGLQGIQGVQGLQGNTGIQGIQGNQGNTGSQGLTGVQGIQGIQGSQGNTGLQGITGQQGIQGAIGPQGLTGSTGAQGVQGNVGTTGAQGVQGNQGNTGLQGVQGIQGIQGIQGPTGATGAQGAAGNPGITGAQGPTGLLGDSLAHHVQIIAGGWLKTGTGTKDVDLTGWQFDNDEFVGQNAGVDQFVLDRATGKATWAAGKGVLDARGIVQNIGGNLLLSTPYGGIGSTQNYLDYPEDFTQWNATSATITANDSVAPTGDATADKIVFTSGGTVDYQVLDGSFVITDQFVFSVWLKASGSINAKLRIDGSISDYTETTFALTTSWQRFEVFVATTNTPYPVTLWIKDNGSGSTLWAWGAQLEKAVFGTEATVYTPFYLPTRTYGTSFKNLRASNPILNWSNGSSIYESTGLVIDGPEININSNVIIDTSAATVTSFELKTKNSSDIVKYNDQSNNNIYRAVYDGSNFHHYFSSGIYYNIGAHYFTIDSGGGVGGFTLSGGTRMYMDTGANSPYVALNLGAMSYATDVITLGSQYGPSITTFAWNGANGYTLSSTSYLKQSQLSANNGDAKLEFMNNSFDPMLTLNFLNKYIGLSNTSPSALLHPILTNASTASIDTIAIFGHQSSNTPSNGFGSKIIFQLKSNGADNQSSGEISTSWVDAANSTRKGKLTLGAYDTAFREAISVSASGSEAKIGFFATSPAAKGSLTTYSPDLENTAYTAAEAGKDDIAKLDDLNALRTAYESIRVSYMDLYNKLIATTLVGGSAVN